MARHLAGNHSRPALAAVIVVIGWVGLSCSDDNQGSPAIGAPASETTTTVGGTQPATTTTTTTTATTATTTTIPVLQAPEGDAFYQPPSPLPGSAPGDLIWYAPATNAPAGLTAFKMLYRSETAAGDPIAVSGEVVFSPAVTGPDAPLLSFGHGTTGLGDACAPSRLRTPVDSGYIDIAEQQGWVYVGTDYEGLGTPGDHPYLMGQSEGRSILDAARAATQIPEAPVSKDSPVMIAGHSQGGGAALAAGELAGTYAPDLDVRGVISIAPPSELGLIITTLSSGPLNAFLPMILAGAGAVDPSLDMSLAAGPDALAVVDRAREACGGDLLQSVDGKDAATVGFKDPTADPTWSAVLLANSPGHVSSEVPVLIVHGDADNIVPPGLSMLIQQAGCGVGQTIQRNLYPGADHLNVLQASHDDAIAWATDRLAGTSPAPSNCP
jgi:pimeloyl-ACP methyl ester carboxylesterase